MNILESLVAAEKSHAAVAAKLGVGPSAISNWKKKGIPPAQWPKVAALAKKHGLHADMDTLAATKPSHSRRRERR